jgi:hypothetical protein
MLVIEPSPGQLSGDAGLLPIRQFDEQIGLTQTFSAALDDPRDPALSAHTFREMVRSRVYGILAGYEDQNDHGTLRHDPVFKLLADRSPEGHDLASRPTPSLPRPGVRGRGVPEDRSGRKSRARPTGGRRPRPCGALPHPECQVAQYRNSDTLTL